MANRPGNWNAQDAQAAQALHAAAPEAQVPPAAEVNADVGANQGAACGQVDEFIVPPHILEMLLAFGPGVVYLGPIMEMFNHVWVNEIVTYPVYAVKMNSSHIDASEFYLSVLVSSSFPLGQWKQVQFFFADGVLPIPGKLKKRMDKMVHFARKGWLEVVQLFEGQIVVLAMRNLPGPDDVVSVRIFPVAG
ncbi:unnamed protein product [Urochloa humidicola]